MNYSVAKKIVEERLHFRRSGTLNIKGRLFEQSLS